MGSVLLSSERHSSMLDSSHMPLCVCFLSMSLLNPAETQPSVLTLCWAEQLSKNGPLLRCSSWAIWAQARCTPGKVKALVKDSAEILILTSGALTQPCKIINSQTKPLLSGKNQKESTKTPGEICKYSLVSGEARMLYNAASSAVRP